MTLFKKKPKKTITKYRVYASAGNIRHCIDGIPTEQEAMTLMNNILNSGISKRWVKFGSFYFLNKDVKHIQLDSYTEKVSK